MESSYAFLALGQLIVLKAHFVLRQVRAEDLLPRNHALASSLRACFITKSADADIRNRSVLTSLVSSVPKLQVPKTMRNNTTYSLS